MTLREVVFQDHAATGCKMTFQSEDFFAWAEAQNFTWPRPDSMVQAAFEVKFSESKKKRQVTLFAPNKAKYGRDDDSLLVEQWLSARGFITITKEEISDPIRVVA